MNTVTSLLEELTCTHYMQFPRDFLRHPIRAITVGFWFVFAQLFGALFARSFNKRLSVIEKSSGWFSPVTRFWLNCGTFCYQKGLQARWIKTNYCHCR